MSNGDCATSEATSTGTETIPTPACAVGVGDDGDDKGSGAGAGFVEHAPATATTAARVPNRLRCSQTRMHLPYQDLSGRGGGHALTTGGGEPHGISLVQRARALQ